MLIRLALDGFLAYALGALVGGFALLIEALAAGTAPSGGAMAVYSMAGGVLATVLRSVSPPHSALVVAVAFGSVHLLYVANVKLLGGEHYLSGKSLALDAIIMAGALTCTRLLTGLRQAPWNPTQWRGGGAPAGAILLFTGALNLLATWPRTPSAVQRQGEGPNLLVIVVDSLRRDRLLIGEAGHSATPSLHALTRRGRSFTAAFAASSWTVDSVARILGDQETTLPERLSRRGYLTACFTDNAHLTPGTKLLRGFDRVERSVGAWHVLLHRTVLGEVLERLRPGRDEELASKAIAWASQQPGSFFLYAHLMDSHAPYRFPPLDGRRRPGRRIEFPASGMGLTAEEGDGIRARYDAGVRSADVQAGRIVAAVAALGRPFVAVITADHGESLGESGRWFHKTGLPPEQLAIPLVLVGEGVVPGEVTTPVGHSAIAPTLLAAAGIPCGDCVDLRSQSGSGIVEGGLPPRLAYRIAGRYKVVLDFETGRRQLFDWRAEPEERRDLAGDHAEIAARLSAGLTVGPHPPTPESVERLRSLGYAGS